MNYFLENDKIKVEISDFGAELQSIFGKNTKHEYLWQATRPELWKNRATILFPICGRLFNGKYTYEGKEYEMVLHGFAKKRVFNVVEKSENKIIFELTYDEETLKIYPFKFNLKVIYTIIDSTVRTEFLVENVGSDDLPFSVGGHPGFAIPLEDGLDFDDHYIEFDKAEKRSAIDLSESCLYLGTSSPYELENDKILRLTHELFANDAIFMDEKQGSATLKSDKSKRFIKVSYNGMNHLGFWQTYGSDTNFICIEPWAGVPAIEGKTDDFATKKEFFHIRNGEKFDTYFDITVSE